MKKFRIQNGQIFDEQGSFREGSLYFIGEKIVTEEEYRASELPEETVDAKGGYVIPGLVDIHLHGCAGHDCCEGTPEAFRAMAEYELSQGITSITPATMTVPEEKLMQIARAVREVRDPDTSGEGDVCEAAADVRRDSGADALGEDDAAVGAHAAGAALRGLYMEGPFISAQKKGAQRADDIRKPDLALFQRLQEASDGVFRIVALAPETEGAMELIRALSGNMTISIAHTEADYETACEAFRNGASQLTHLFNAMPPLTHRAPGPIAAAADFEGCRAELICDGVHVHPAAVRAAFRLFGDDRIIFISDSMEATGMPDGEYELGGQKVFVEGRRALLADGTLAGSVTNLADCLRVAVKEMGIPLTSAVKCAAVNPAKAVGIYEEYGSLSAGKFADLLILDEELGLKQVFRHGRQTMKQTGQEEYAGQEEYIGQKEFAGQKEQAEREAQRKEASGNAPEAWDVVFHQKGEPFLVQHLEDLPNKPHTAYPEFGDMTARCAGGDADAMEALADWFEQWSQREDVSPFYLRASNYWRYRAYRKGNPEAKEWFERYFAEHPGEQLESILPENSNHRIGYYSHSIPGGLLNALGFSFFDPKRKYEIKQLEGDDLVEVSAFESYEGPDEDGFGAEFYFDWWYLDENMQPFPGIKRMTATVSDTDASRFKEAQAKAREILRERKTQSGF